MKNFVFIIYFKKKATDEKESIILELSPKFIWVLRDFTLNKTLPGTDIEIDNREYLEISLRKKANFNLLFFAVYSYTYFFSCV